MDSNGDEHPDSITCGEGGTKIQEKFAQASPSPLAMKRNIIENVSLIKKLYNDESKLRSVVEKLESQKNSTIIENTRLNNENQELREVLSTNIDYFQLTFRLRIADRNARLHRNVK